MSAMVHKAATCRGCRVGLVTWNGEPAEDYCFSTDMIAYHPVSKGRAKRNYYGGFVCSEQCDRRACLKLENSMPGHGGKWSSTLSCYSAENLKGKWQ